MRIAICDDQIEFVELIKNHIVEIEGNPTKELLSFSSGEDLLKFAQTGEVFDVVFLDVEMKEINGIQTAQEIRKINKKVIIVFITSYADYAIQGYKVSALDYIQKPISLLEFRKVYSRVKDYFDQINRKISINIKGELIVLNISDILYLETRLRKVYLCTKNMEYVLGSKFEEECEKFFKYNFISVHRCCIVNMENIEKVGKKIVKLNNGYEILISRDKQKDVLRLFSRYLME